MFRNKGIWDKTKELIGKDFNFQKVHYNKTTVLGTQSFM